MIAQMPRGGVIYHGAGCEQARQIRRHEDVIVLKSMQRVLSEECLDFLAVEMPVAIDKATSRDTFEERPMAVPGPNDLTEACRIQVTTHDCRTGSENRFGVVEDMIEVRENAIVNDRCVYA